MLDGTDTDQYSVLQSLEKLILKLIMIICIHQMRNHPDEDTLI